MSSLPAPRYTPQQYLEMERKAESKHEYVNGEIIPHGEALPIRISEPEAQARHELLLNATTAALKKQIQTPGFHVIERTNIGGVVADVIVIEETTPGHEKGTPQPVVVVQVLSPYTEADDRGRDAIRVRNVPTVRHLLLVAQDDVRVEHFARREEKSWLYRPVYGLDGCINLSSLDCRLMLSDIYAHATFAHEFSLPDDQVPSG